MPSAQTLRHAQTPPLGGVGLTARAPASRWIVPSLALLLLAGLAFSPGYLEIDELSHFLTARQADTDAYARIAIWSRPACTDLYAFAAPFGLAAARLLAACVTILVALGTVQLSRLLWLDDRPDGRLSFGRRHHVAALWLLLFAQPMFLLYSASVMTEMLLALSWVWAAILLLRGRILWSSFALGLGVLARPEGLIAVALWPLFLKVFGANLIGVQAPGQVQATCSDSPLRETLPEGRVSNNRRFIRAILLALTPALAWYLAGAYVLSSSTWFLRDWPYPANSPYHTNGWLFLLSLAAAATWMWPLIGLAAAHACRKMNRPAIALLILPAACFILLHGILGTFRFMGSMCLPRYFIPLAPIFAILTLRAFALLEYRLAGCFARSLAAAFVLFSLLPLTASLAFGLIPIPRMTDARRIEAACRAVTATLTTTDALESRLIVRHPWAAVFLNLPSKTRCVGRSFDLDAVRHAPAGTIVITDNALWQYEGGPSDADMAAWGYTLDRAAQTRIDAEPNLPDITTYKVGGGSIGEVIVHVWKK